MADSAEPPTYAIPPITPPSANTLIINGNSKIAQIALTQEEQIIFQRDLGRLAAMYSLEDKLYRLLADDMAALMGIAALAKGSIGTNPTFTGLSAAGNEIGFQLIRSATVLSNNTVNNSALAAPLYNWVQTYTGPGWTNTFGSSGSPCDLSSTGIAGFPVTNTQNRVLLAIIGLLDAASSPQLQEVRFHVQQVDYMVEPLAWEPATDLYYTKLHGIYVVPVNGKFWMRGNVQPSTTGGIDQTELFGLAFTTGDYLTYE